MNYFADQMLGNLQGSGIVYLVCIAAIVGAFKYLDRSPQAKKFTLLGAFLIIGSGLGGSLLVGIIHQVMLGSYSVNYTSTADWKELARQADAQRAAFETWAWMSRVLYFLIGAANAAGIASLAWAVFVERIKLSAKKKPKRKPARRSRNDDEDDDDEDDDEDERPRRRRSRRDDDDDD